jgi:thiosulfate/3-mercaptopyruvate sulfurtransferase
VLVTPEWLSAHLSDPELVVVDLRWDERGRGRARYEEGHVEGAVFCDWATDLVDPDHRYAFMLAPPERLAAMLGGLGIGDDTAVVAYADAGHSGPFRLWWACSVYGHAEQVRILDGGLDAWLAAGGALSKPSPKPARATWTPRTRRAELVASAEDVLAARDDPDTVVFDSRPAANFEGAAVWSARGEIPASDGVARPPGGELRAGHVPWAVHVPWHTLYRADLTMKTPAELAALFASAGCTPEKRALSYCSVGLTASALLYALELAGITNASLYDAGWDEWGRNAALPVARG